MSDSSGSAPATSTRTVAITSSGRPLPRGTVTFLFTDIQGSTRLLQELGDAYFGILQSHNEIMREAIAAGGGTEIATEGDSFFVVFPSAPGAVRAAVAAQRAFASHPDAEIAALRVRMGLHTGEALLAGDNYGGIDVNRAARIAASGHGGQIIVSDTTRSLVEHTLPEGVSLRDLGSHRLKDLARREHLWQLSIAELQTGFPELRTLDARPTNLRVPPTTFVGREQEIEQIRALLTENRLVTLTGPGGMGKTRTAVQAGARLLSDYPDGVFFVPLAPISDPELVPSAIASVIGATEQPGRDAAATLLDHLSTKSMLLILDNFEQIVDGAGFVTELLESAGAVKVIVTSREVLRLRGEQEVPVPPLALPDLDNLPSLDALSQYDSVALFIQRARSVNPLFSVDDANAPAIAEICARLDGLPLAIELAAARVKMLTPQAMLGRLEGRLDLLAGGARDLPARQQTLRSTIAWSYDLLDPVEQELFAALSVFSGGFTLEAAEWVWSSPGGSSTLDLLESLVDKSLVLAEPVEETTRFRMLVTIGEFAREHLEQDPRAPEVRAAHAALYMQVAEAAVDGLTGPDQKEVYRQLERDEDNFRAALGWAVENDALTALRLSAALRAFWRLSTHFREGLMWLRRALAIPGATEHRAERAAALTAAADLSGWTDDPSYLALAEQALALYRELGDARGTADALMEVGAASGGTGDPALGYAAFEEATRINRELGDTFQTAASLLGLGLTGLLLGKDAEARGQFEESVALFGALDEQQYSFYSSRWLAHVDFVEGRADDARRRFRETLTALRDDDNPVGLATILDGVAELEVAAGHAERAAQLIGAADALRGDVGAGFTFTVIIDVPMLAREQLSEAEFERAYAEGREMEAAAAIAAALAVLGPEG